MLARKRVEDFGTTDFFTKGTPVWKRRSKRWVVRVEAEVIDVTDKNHKHSFHVMLSYTPSRPYSAFVEFDVQEIWEFGRELLEGPLYANRPSGLGDVQFWPDGRRHVMMLLISSGGSRRYRIKRSKLSRFARRAFKSVSRGSECNRLNFDEEITHLLEQQA